MGAINTDAVVEGLITYIGLVILLTFHEFGHAWVALKCGDDTAKQQGRVSLNPLMHIDPIGTVLMPLLMIFLPVYAGNAGNTASQFMIGWAKPVPVDLNNLGHRNRDDILITMAGPFMNLLLAVVLVALVRVGLLVHLEPMAEVGVRFASLSLLLCFFNLIPIPPLDGSRVLRVVIGMSYETYWHLSRFGFIAIILVLQIPLVRDLLATAVGRTLLLLVFVFGLPVQ